MTKEEIIKGIINDLPIPSLRSEMTSDEWYGWFEEAIDQYATQIVLDKLPGDLSIESHWHDVSDKFGAAMSNYQTDEGFEGWKVGMKQMRTIATQRITTREEVEKPYRELLEECRAYNMPPSLRQRINQLLNP